MLEACATTFSCLASYLSCLASFCFCLLDIASHIAHADLRLRSHPSASLFWAPGLQIYMRISLWPTSFYFLRRDHTKLTRLALSIRSLYFSLLSSCEYRTAPFGLAAWYVFSLDIMSTQGENICSSSCALVLDLLPRPKALIAVRLLLLARPGSSSLYLFLIV